jgi:hypothetical protein
MSIFDDQFRKQLHFNFSATRNSAKQRESRESTRASWLREIDLDVELPPSQQLLSTKWHEMSRYILEDILDCPVNSCLMVCVSADRANLERGDYYAEKALIIADKIKRAGLETESWRMSGRRYIVIQGILDRSSHYSDIKIKSVSRRQFVDAFENESGDLAMRFDGISSRLTIPWRGVVHASRTIMIFGVQFDQVRSFTSLFRKMKPQHAHHILCRFGSEYFGDSRACSMLFIEYQQVRLDAAVADLEAKKSSAESDNLFDKSLFKTEEVVIFQYWFDRYCKHAFLNCMNGYNDYSQPLIVPQDFMNYLSLSKHIFPQ